jgi:hypothetical protein
MELLACAVRFMQPRFVSLREVSFLAGMAFADEGTMMHVNLHFVWHISFLMQTSTICVERAVLHDAHPAAGCSEQVTCLLDDHELHMSAATIRDVERIPFD